MYYNNMSEEWCGGALFFSRENADGYLDILPTILTLILYIFEVLPCQEHARKHLLLLFLCTLLFYDYIY